MANAISIGWPGLIGKCCSIFLGYSFLLTVSLIGGFGMMESTAGQTESQVHASCNCLARTLGVTFQPLCYFQVVIKVNTYKIPCLTTSANTKGVEIMLHTACSCVFLRNFNVFGNLVKHSLKCLI